MEHSITKPISLPRPLLLNAAGCYTHLYLRFSMVQRGPVRFLGICSSALVLASPPSTPQQHGVPPRRGFPIGTLLSVLSFAPCLQHVCSMKAVTPHQSFHMGPCPLRYPRDLSAFWICHLSCSCFSHTIPEFYTLAPVFR